MLAFFSISPMDKGESLGEFVAASLDLIDKSGLAYKVGPMGTTVEGEWDEVMQLIRDCHMLMRDKSRRIATSIKIDDRVDASGRLTGKLDSIETRLGRKLER
jgi:uncharacterized protein (TIGR00106 family)